MVSFTFQGSAKELAPLWLPLGCPVPMHDTGLGTSTQAGDAGMGLVFCSGPADRSFAGRSFAGRNFAGRHREIMLGNEPCHWSCPADAFLLYYVIFKNMNFQPLENPGVCFPVVLGEAAAASALPGDTEVALCKRRGRGDPSAAAPATGWAAPHLALAGS